MVGWLGFKQIAVEYERDPRFAGETHYPVRKMLRFAIDAITSFSTIPLRFASLLGMGFGVAGLLALVWVGVSWLSGGVVLGWTSLAALILILGSMQLMMLGIFGEYLGRMYMEAKQRPLYLVDEVYRQPDMAAGASAETEGLQRALSS
jgi:dolichol-phosphate mannosyltransferase